MRAVFRSLSCLDSTLLNTQHKGKSTTSKKFVTGARLVISEARCCSAKTPGTRVLGHTSTAARTRLGAAAPVLVSGRHGRHDHGRAAYRNTAAAKRKNAGRSGLCPHKQRQQLLFSIRAMHLTQPATIRGAPVPARATPSCGRLGDVHRQIFYCFISSRRSLSSQFACLRAI